MVMQVSARQLHLFRGKRQRGSVPPAPTEFASQCVLVDIVRRWLDPMALHPHGLGEYRDPATACRLQRLGTMPGWPDLQFAGPNRQMVFSN